jgi:phage repressor protein C with HTH and peptisase S24 domain
MLKFIKVTGNSLYPEYREGDYVMILTLPFLSFKRGDTIVFQHPNYGEMIKTIDRIDSDKIQVIGTHPSSIDSRRFGPIDRNSVLGKVIWHIKKN